MKYTRLYNKRTGRVIKIHYSHLHDYAIFNDLHKGRKYKVPRNDEDIKRMVERYRQKGFEPLNSEQ